MMLSLLFIDLSHLTPLSIACTIFTSVLIPTAGYTWTNGTKLLKRFNRLDGKVKDVCRDIDNLKDSCKTADAKLITIQDAIQEIRNATQRSDESFKIITIKLEALLIASTRLEETTKATALIVPRNEVDARFKALEEQVKNYGRS